mmetsp:Transcript_18207/g.43626  ORF Transcript_18207/g.43626 Transcript_18207/m.43626 type:complete len:222 (-) Transcript_18207:186-851(-)
MGDRAHLGLFLGAVGDKHQGPSVLRPFEALERARQLQHGGNAGQVVVGAWVVFDGAVVVGILVARPPAQMVVVPADDDDFMLQLRVGAGQAADDIGRSRGAPQQRVSRVAVRFTVGLGDLGIEFLKKAVGSRRRQADLPEQVFKISPRPFVAVGARQPAQIPAAGKLMNQITHAPGINTVSGGQHLGAGAWRHLGMARADRQAQRKAPTKMDQAWQTTTGS